MHDASGHLGERAFDNLFAWQGAALHEGAGFVRPAPGGYEGFRDGDAVLDAHENGEGIDTGVLSPMLMGTLTRLVALGEAVAGDNCERLRDTAVRKRNTG